MEIVILMCLAIVMMVVAMALMIAMLKLYYHRVSPGQALVIQGARGMRVSFTNGVVVPVINSAHTVDCTLKTVPVSYDEAAPLRTSDRRDVQVGMNFNVHIPQVEADVLRVIATYGMDHAAKMQPILRPLFRQAVEKAAATRTVRSLYDDQADFIAAVEAEVPDQLDGYALHSVSLERLWPTPLDDAPA